MCASWANRDVRVLYGPFHVVLLDVWSMIAGASPVDCHKQVKQAQGPTPNVQQAESEDKA